LYCYEAVVASHTCTVSWKGGKVEKPDSLKVGKSESSLLMMKDTFGLSVIGLADFYSTVHECDATMMTKKQNARLKKK
jgi:hypothetical protein